jgi:hypothetical protein
MLRTLFAACAALFIFVSSYPVLASDAPASPCTPYWGDLHAPILKKGTPAYKFRTRIKEDAQTTGINVCGQYTFISIEFTGPFQINFLVNRKTGTVYPAPASETGVKFSIDDNILVLNPRDPDYDIPGVEPPVTQFFIWTGSEFEEVTHPINPEILSEIEGEVMQEWCASRPDEPECASE